MHCGGYRNVFKPIIVNFLGKKKCKNKVRLWAPKTHVVSYADLAMGLIDEKAKFGGAMKPLLWWRYRDDVFDVWTQWSA